jgi:arylsulfatase A-like enzyme
MRNAILTSLLLLVISIPTLAATKLNVLFIISDDLRAEPACFGGKAKTPNIDALAAAGVKFDRAYCQYPLCNPSRSSMLTGRYPIVTGVLGNRTRFREAHPDWVTLPEYFKKNGYVTGRAGKIFHGGLDDAQSWSEGTDRGGDTEEDAAPPTPAPTSRSTQPALTRAQYSDRWIVLDGEGEAHGDFKTAERTIAFLRRHRDEPFFAACGFVKPHSPPSAPQRFYDLYPLDTIELPPDFAPRPTVPAGFPRGSIRPRNADLFIGRDATPQQAKEMTRAYLASTSWVDSLTGKVTAEVDRLGLRDKTIIVFWGDHGYQLGEKGKWSKAGSLWEQGARVPTIIAAPGMAGNRSACERVVQSLDFYPTLVELCGLPRRDELEGLSLLPLLNDPKTEWNHPAFTIWSEDGRTIHGAAIRNDKWRYAEFGDGAMLLDEANDPAEMKNVVDDPANAAVRAELSAQLKKYTSRYTPPPAAPQR